MSDHAAPLKDPSAAAESDLIPELTRLIVEALNLDMASRSIEPDQPLYGDGLGLDSIDILEIALVVSKRYGVQLRADSAGSGEIFGSLRRLAAYIGAHRTR